MQITTLYSTELYYCSLQLPSVHWTAEAWIHMSMMDTAERSLEAYLFLSPVLRWNFSCSFLSYCREANLHTFLTEREERAGSSRWSVSITKNKKRQGYFGLLINSTTQARIVNNFCYKWSVTREEQNSTEAGSTSFPEHVPAGQSARRAFWRQLCVFCKYSALASGRLQRVYAIQQTKEEREQHRTFREVRRQ